MLSGLEAIHGGQVIRRFPTRQTTGLFAYLTRFSHREHSREALVERNHLETLYHDTLRRLIHA